MSASTWVSVIVHSDHFPLLVVVANRQWTGLRVLLLAGGLLVRIFLTLPRRLTVSDPLGDSCVGACSVESGRSMFPYLLSVLQYYPAAFPYITAKAKIIIQMLYN